MKLVKFSLMHYDYATSYKANNRSEKEPHIIGDVWINADKVMGVVAGTNGSGRSFPETSHVSMGRSYYWVDGSPEDTVQKLSRVEEHV